MRPVSGRGGGSGRGPGHRWSSPAAAPLPAYPEELRGGSDHAPRLRTRRRQRPWARPPLVESCCRSPPRLPRGASRRQRPCAPSQDAAAAAALGQATDAAAAAAVGQATVGRVLLPLPSPLTPRSFEAAVTMRPVSGRGGGSGPGPGHRWSSPAAAPLPAYPEELRGGSDHAPRLRTRRRQRPWARPPLVESCCRSPPRLPRGASRRQRPCAPSQDAAAAAALGQATVARVLLPLPSPLTPRSFEAAATMRPVSGRGGGSGRGPGHRCSSPAAAPLPAYPEELRGGSDHAPRLRTRRRQRPWARPPLVESCCRSPPRLPRGASRRQRPCAPSQDAAAAAALGQATVARVLLPLPSPLTPRSFEAAATMRPVSGRGGGSGRGPGHRCSSPAAAPLPAYPEELRGGSDHAPRLRTRRRQRPWARPPLLESCCRSPPRLPRGASRRQRPCALSQDAAAAAAVGQATVARVLLPLPSPLTPRSFEAAATMRPVSGRGGGSGRGPGHRWSSPAAAPLPAYPEELRGGSDHAPRLRTRRRQRPWARPPLLESCCRSPPRLSRGASRRQRPCAPSQDAAAAAALGQATVARVLLPLPSPLTPRSFEAAATMRPVSGRGGGSGRGPGHRCSSPAAAPLPAYPEELRGLW
ncbi:UNVERIFIED_CONTAM: hypothetical protein K2H54_016498 [Gekko kuhli]